MTLLTRILLVLVVSASGVAASAQQSSPPPANSSVQTPASSSSSSATSSPAPSQQQTNEQQSQQRPVTSEEEMRQMEKQRALGVVPMFEMSNANTARPLTPKQKFRLMVRQMYDPFTFISAGLTAGLGQATDSFPQYGQGASGFGKRYGAAFADNADSNFFSNYVYPVIFKQDPRYLRIGQGTVKERLWYAIKMEFIAKKDFDGYEFNYSTVLGAVTAGTISNIYYPSQSRGVGLTAGRAATALGYGTLGDIFLEFWPDVDKRVFHHQTKQAHSGDSPQ